MKFYESILANIKAFFGMEPDATEAEVDAKLEAVKTREALEAEIRAQVKAEYEAQLAQLESDKQNATQHVADLQAENSRLEIRIAELEKQPAAEHTQGATETPPAEAVKSTWTPHPFNERAKALLSGK